MHKKSLEAAHKLQQGEMDEDKSPSSRDKNEIRSESIASLRAKAQEHSAKMMEVLNSTGSSGNKSDDSSSHLLSSDTSSDDIDLTRLTQSQWNIYTWEHFHWSKGRLFVSISGIVREFDLRGWNDMWQNTFYFYSWPQ